MELITSLFCTILSMSYGASIVIVVVLIVRLLFKKAPKIFSYTLWLFVLIRLLIPISFESKVSVLSVPSTITYQVLDDMPKVSEEIQKTVYQGIEVNQSISLMNILALIWIIGIVMLILYFSINYIKLKQRLRYSIRVVDNIYESDSILSPFIVGVFHPKIYIPMNLNERQKQIILAHEIIHIERKDSLIKFVGIMILTVYWFHPLVWLSFYLMSKDMEFSCDEKVVNRLGTECKQRFGMTLLDFATSPYVMVVSFKESNTKERIKNMLNYKKPKFWVLIFCVVIGLFLIVPLLTNPKSAPEPTPKIAPTPIVNETREPTNEATEESEEIQAFRDEINDFTIEELEERKTLLVREQEEIEKEIEVLENEESDLLIKNQRMEELLKKLNMNKAKIEIINSNTEIINFENAVQEMKTDLENKNLSYIAPLDKYEVTCSWGCYIGHEAFDIRDPNNSNADVKAIADGIVNEASYDTNNGNYIIIGHDNGQSSYYGQLKDESTLEVGAKVNQGDKLGVTGMSGKASGSHLHFFIMETETQSRLSNSLELVQ